MKLRSFVITITLISLSGCFLYPRGLNSTAGIDEIGKQIKAVDCDNHDRAGKVKKLFLDSGARERDISLQKFDDGQNILLTLKGKSSETVVLGAHYDKTTSGCGAIDNWTGIVILANMFRELRLRENQKTYIFVAFDQEEKGLKGSKVMAEQIPEDTLKNYCAMINFDSFGFSETWALKDISDKKLIDLAGKIADRRNASFSIKEFAGASSDSKSFQEIGIPAITLSGLGDNWRKYLHKSKDQVEFINIAKVFENLKFSTQLINEIDAKRCEAFR